MGKVTEATLSRQNINIWRATLTLGLAIMLTRATNFVTQMVIAHRFGASVETDAYFVAENIIIVLNSFIVTGFVVAFIPLWMEYQVQRGEREAQDFSDAFISLTTGATILLAVVIFLSADSVVQLVAPGFGEQAAKIAAQLLRTMAPALAFIGFTGGCTGILHGNRRFLVPELSYMSYNLVILMAAIAFSGRLGVVALAWGTILGSIIRLIIQLPNALRLGTIHLTRRINHEGVRQAGKRILPIILAYAGIEITMLIANVVASGLPEGAISGLTYATRVMLIPIGLLALPLQTTIFPTLSQHVAKEQLTVMGETAIKGLCLLSFIMIPVSALLILLRVPTIQLLFERGAFDSTATHITASILGLYCLALPAISGLMLVNSIYCSLGEPFTSAKFNLFNWAAIFGLSLVLVQRFGPGGIALSVALTTTVTYIWALLTLKQRLPTFRLRSLGMSISKAIIATGLMTIVLLGLKALLTGAFSGFEVAPILLTIITLTIIVLVGVSVYWLVALTLKMDEVFVINRAVLNWIRQRGKTR
jgi:putative peptidoglycan lipid II flippase